jgi:type I restriction enzyme S subunit
MNKVKLSDVADVKLSNVDKKIKSGEREVKLCNYTDVYKNWSIKNDMIDGFMTASCNDNEFEKFQLKKGQVAITKDSETSDDIGVSTYIAEDFENVVLGYHLSLITPFKEKLNGQYLNYLFHTNHLKRYFECNAGGSGQRYSLSIDTIKGIPLLLPNIQTQSAIAHTLSSLDDKIELNNKINKELENLAITIYEYWFVQNAEESWERKKIGEIAEVIRGTMITEKQTKEGSIKVVAGGIDYSYCHSEFNRERNTITVSASGANAGFINFWREEIFASDCTTVRGETDFDTMLMFHHLKMNQENIFRLAKGSAQPHVYPSDIKDILFYDIPQDIKGKFNPIFTAINEQIAKNQKENSELARLRDFLLPLLMNGQGKFKNNVV